MKLCKLYCNKDFHNISFITENGGLNIIVGDAKGKKQHNLGKTKLADLLDFMLLKSVDKKFFFYTESNKQKFAGHEFYLELLLNSGRFLTIKRPVENHTKISFKLREKQSDGFILYEDFDVEPTSFDKSKKYLNDLLSFDFCVENDESYRRLVNYSLRLQGDYEPKKNTIFQLSKFNNKNDKDSWRALVFSILGFQGNLLIKKYELEEKIKQGTKNIKEQEKDFGIKSQDKDLLIGRIQNTELEKENLSKELENLNFYKEDHAIIQDLVGNVEQEVANLNSQLYVIEYEIRKLQDAIRESFSFDIDKVKRLFQEVSLHFPDSLSKSYEQLFEFNVKLTQERNLQIRQTLEEKKQEKKKIETELLALNQKREAYRDLIQDTTLFKKYTVYQKKVVELEKELSTFQTQLNALDEMEKKREKIEETQRNDLQNVKEQLKYVIENTASCELYMDIRRTFSQIVKKVLNEDALITITPNSNFNIEFHPSFPNSSKAEGSTYYKILCIAFDLAILINYRKKSHFRFVYHDDIMAGDDNGIKTRLIETVFEISKEHDIQYIFSAIQDDLPPAIDLSNNTIVRLHDKDDSGKLFKMSF